MYDEAALRIALGAAYAVAALLAAIAGRAAPGRERAFWLFTVLTLLVLMAAKEINLLDELTQTARSMVKASGWYGIHRKLQGAFAFALAAAGLVLAAVLARWLRDSLATVKIAAAAVVFLIAFLGLRAVSIHAVDHWTMTVVGGMRIGWWAEFAAALLISAAALREMAARRERVSSA